MCSDLVVRTIHKHNQQIAAAHTSPRISPFKVPGWYCCGGASIPYWQVLNALPAGSSKTTVHKLHGSHSCSTNACKWGNFHLVSSNNRPVKVWHVSQPDVQQTILCAPASTLQIPLHSRTRQSYWQLTSAACMQKALPPDLSVLLFVFRRRSLVDKFCLMVDFVASLT